MDPRALVPILSPHGRLNLIAADDTPALEPALAQRLAEAFARGSGHGLLQLGAGEVGTALPSVLAYWRDLGARYMNALCTLADAEERGTKVHVPAPLESEFESTAAAAPPMIGAEYLTGALLHALWEEIDTAFAAELSTSRASVQDFLRHRGPAWNLVGRVHFNLAENRKDDAAPFAFLATYTTRLSAHGKAQHLPLGQALHEFAGVANRQRLLSLLVPVQRAAEGCPWLKGMVDAGEISHPLRWTPPEAFRFLADVPQLEGAGVVVRMPAAWKGNRPARPNVTATVGENVPAGLGQNALLDFRMEVTLDGEPLTAAELEGLLAMSNGLALVRGRWVEVDHARLSRTLDRFRHVEQVAADRGLTFAQAMRMLAGADEAPDDEPASVETNWSQVVAGAWLATTPAARRGWRASILARCSTVPCERTSRSACGGSTCYRSLVSEPALPTTWVWERPFKCSRCCCSSRARRQPGNRQACSWPPPPCSQIGPRRSSDSRQRYRRSWRTHRPFPPPNLPPSRRSASRTWIWSSPATARCAA